MHAISQTGIGKAVQTLLLAGFPALTAGGEPTIAEGASKHSTVGPFLGRGPEPPDSFDNSQGSSAQNPSGCGSGRYQPNRLHSQ